MNKLIFAGGVNMDIVARVQKTPGTGRTALSPDFKYVAGGKGLNQAVAASRLGASVSFLGKIGSDHFGQNLASFLKKEKLDIKNLAVSESKPTGTVMIIVDVEGNNTMVWMKGSNFDVSTNQIKNLPIRKGDIVASTFELPQTFVKNLFLKARAAKAVTVLNPSPEEAMTTHVFKLADYVIMNEHELAFFSKTKNFNQALKKLALKGQTLIVTLGKRGLVCFKDGKLVKIPAHKVKVVDATAAGDCFLGAFAAALSENKDLKSALTFANAAAALSVQKIGASSSLPNRRTVDEFLKRQ